MYPTKTTFYIPSSVLFYDPYYTTMGSLYIFMSPFSQHTFEKIKYSGSDASSRARKGLWADR